MALSNRLPFRCAKPACCFSGVVVAADHLRVGDFGAGVVLAKRAAGAQSSAPSRIRPFSHQLGDHGGQAAGAEIGFAQIFAGRHHVDEQRDVVADAVPVVIGQLDADMAGDGVDMRRAVGRGADGRCADDGVLERLARHDVRGAQILMHHGDDALAGLIGDLPALAVGRGDGGAAGQRHAQRLGHGVHRGGRAHGVAMADARRGGPATISMKVS